MSRRRVGQLRRRRWRRSGNDRSQFNAKRQAGFGVSSASKHQRRGTRRLGRGILINVRGATPAVRRAIARAARATLKGEEVDAGRLEVVAVGEVRMRREHARWLGVDRATDVLAFDLRDERRRGTVDGQIVVCTTVARQEARQRGHDWRAELLLYVVHGCLHLCGYDDHSAAGFRRMHRREDQVLKKLGRGEVFGKGTGIGERGTERHRGTEARR